MGMKTGRRLPPLSPYDPCPLPPLDLGGALAELASARLQLLHAWWWRMDSDWAMVRRVLPHGMVFLPIDRSVVIELADQPHVVAPGQLMVLPAGVPQAARYHGRSPPSFDLLAIHLVLTDRHGRDLLPRFPRRSCAVPGWPASRPRLRQLAEQAHAGGPDGLAAAAMALRNLLAEVILAVGGLAPLPAPDPRVSRCLQRIATEATGRLSVEELAREVGVSSRHLRDLFRASTGLSPTEHLIRVRIASATRLLADSTLRLGDIAKQLGFTTDQEFHACFRRVLGVTPSAWRQRAEL